ARTPAVSAAARTVAGFSPRNTPTVSTSGGTAAASSAARSGVICRGLAVITSPMASAPASTAAATAPGSVRPQIFTYTPKRLAAPALPPRPRQDEHLGSPRQHPRSRRAVAPAELHPASRAV